METYREGFITKSFHSISSPLLFKKKKSLVADRDHDRRHLRSSSGAVKKGRRGQEPPPWGVMCLAALGWLRAALLELTFRRHPRERQRRNVYNFCSQKVRSWRLPERASVGILQDVHLRSHSRRVLIVICGRVAGKSEDGRIALCAFRSLLRVLATLASHTNFLSFCSLIHKTGMIVRVMWGINNVMCETWSWIWVSASERSLDSSPWPSSPQFS